MAPSEDTGMQRVTGHVHPDPAGTRVWMLAVLPWIVVVPLAAAFGASNYSDGRNMVKGLHGLKWLGETVIIAAAYVAALIVGIVFVLIYRQRLRSSRRGWLALMLLLLSPCAPLAAGAALPRAFNLGRYRAYAALDHEAICRDAWFLRQQLQPDTSECWYYLGEEDSLDSLPAAIRQLGPTYVIVRPESAVINLDGGGVMYHEGIGIAFTNSATYRKALADRFKPLHPSLPVFLYRLYDGRIFVDTAQRLLAGAGPATRPTSAER